jgi:hypothetical protein
MHRPPKKKHKPPVPPYHDATGAAAPVRRKGLTTWKDFLFDAREFMSETRFAQMSSLQVGVWMRVRAAMWMSPEPGTLPLDLSAGPKRFDFAAKLARLDPRSLRDFVAKLPRCFAEIDGKLVDQDLREQWANNMKRSASAAIGGHAKASAFAKRTQNTSSSSSSYPLFSPPTTSSSSSNEKHPTTTSAPEIPKDLFEALVTKGIQIPLKLWNPEAYQEDYARGRTASESSHAIKFRPKQAERLWAQSWEEKHDVVGAEIVRLVEQKVIENLTWKRPGNPVWKWQSFLTTAVVDELAGRKAS